VLSAVNQASQDKFLVRSLPVNFFRSLLLYKSYVTSLLQGVNYSLTTMAEPRITPQDFQPAQRPKRKRGQLPAPSGAFPTLFSPNQFAVLSDRESDAEENRAPLQPPDRTPRITPIVIYSLLDNHSSTLEQVNDKLTTSVNVKAKTDRLLLYTKSSAYYNILCQKSNQPNWPTTLTHYQKSYNPGWY